MKHDTDPTFLNWHPASLSEIQHGDRVMFVSSDGSTRAEGIAMNGPRSNDPLVFVGQGKSEPNRNSLQLGGRWASALGLVLYRYHELVEHPEGIYVRASEDAPVHGRIAYVHSPPGTWNALALGSTVFQETELVDKADLPHDLTPLTIGPGLQLVQQPWHLQHLPVGTSVLDADGRLFVRWGDGVRVMAGALGQGTGPELDAETPTFPVRILTAWTGK